MGVARTRTTRAGRSPADSSASNTRSRSLVRLAREAVDHQRLGDEVEDRLLRVQRLVRVLEDHPDPGPVALQVARARAFVTSTPSNSDAARRRASELRDHPTRRRLAGPRLAHEAEHLAAPDRQVDPIDRPDDADRGVAERASPNPARIGKWTWIALEPDEVRRHRRTRRREPPSAVGADAAVPDGASRVARRRTTSRGRDAVGRPVRPERWQATRTPSGSVTSGGDAPRGRRPGPSGSAARSGRPSAGRGGPAAGPGMTSSVRRSARMFGNAPSSLRCTDGAGA